MIIELGITGSEGAIFLEKLPDSNPKKITDTLYAEALALYYSGYLDAAAGKYQEILEMDGKNADVLRGLGIVYYRQSQYEEALDLLYQSLEIDSSRAIQYYSLGLVLAKIGYFNQAIQAYHEAINLNPQGLELYNELGNILVETGKLAEAESAYRKAIALDPHHSSSYFNLGNLLMGRGFLDEAIAAYQTALRLKPRFPDIIHNLGLAFSAKNDSTQASLYFGYAAYRQGKYPEAIFHYNNFLENATGDEDFYIALADCYECHNQPEEAIAAYQKGISLYPHATDLYLSFVRSLQNFGRTEEAVQVLNEALFLFPNDLCVKLENQRIIPIVYKNLEQIDIYRQRFSQKLDEIIQHATLETSEAKKKALSALNRGTNFYLQYQGKNDLELQKKYGQFVHQVMASNYPQWIEPLEMPPAAKDGKIRIGYLSACLQWHTVGMVFLGWLRRCNRQQFEVYCYYIEQEEDDVTHLFRLYSDRFYHIPENLEAICKQIISNRVHVLVFLDIGMAPQMTQLAGLRLAPVQCSAWGHPITSGLPTIDYFLSADLLEPDNAPEHYSEKLIRLPNIGISYSKPEIPQRTKSRSYFGLREDAVVYLSCQSLFKYLPQYDRIFAAIAKEIPQAQFVFVAHKSSQLTDIFRHRLQQAFAKIGLESQEYCLILPRQSKLDYWNLNLVSDIFLDTFSFTGFLTTLESVSCNLPIVTYPGEFMRSRQSSGILKMLGVTGTIAKDEADYIRIAVRLGKDREWRNEIVAQMKQRHPYLYDDRTCIEALEAFYLRIFQES